VAAVARALEERLAGRAVRGIWLDRANRSLQVRVAARARRTPDTWVVWNLHPTSGDLIVDEAAREPAGSTVQVAPGTQLRGVTALPDERIVRFDLDAGDAAAGFARAIHVELIGSRWNAIACGAEDAIIALLQVRERGDVQMRPGATYTVPSKAPRAGALQPLTHDAFADIVARNPSDDIRRELTHHVAYMSPINATYIAAPIVMQPGDAGVREAFDRYAALLQSDRGFILDEGRGQPYPSALGRADAVDAHELLRAFAEVASRTPQPTAPPADSVDAAIAATHERIRRIDERIARLTAEALDAAEESSRMRRQADLLFAQLHRVPKGATEVELDDFEGGTVTVELDPSQSGKENAARLHEMAKRRDHAAERVPSMIERASRDRAGIVALRTRLEAGEADAAEIAKWSREALRPPAQSRGQNDDEAVLPYRVYRTTSGIEVRAGRNSRANDALTFHHSKPDDIWLHARDYAGAHVVLRWGRRDANPSARDIEEAATIAAVNSRGRTSGLVPVDWTRRKYVRKRRHAPPGQVMVERAKTVFVAPDADAEKRLRE
jgi:predicted ribosome quality control (RQC) complex YloA/Tae2 family protein